MRNGLASAGDITRCHSEVMNAFPFRKLQCSWGASGRKG
jgi:hypothetical protein